MIHFPLVEWEGATRLKLRIFSIMASLILLLTACTSIRTSSEGKQKAHETKTKEHIVIAAVGDSLTEGVGDPTERDMSARWRILSGQINKSKRST